MKKNIKYLNRQSVLLVVLLLLFTSLVLFLRPCSATVNADDAALICASCSIPNMSGYFEHFGMNIELIETDSYGRTLYRLSGPDCFTGKDQSYYIICQGYGDDYVSFYEDKCYLTADSSEEKFNKLKEMNDWDNKPVEGKATARYVGLTSKGGFVKKNHTYEFDLTKAVRAILKWNPGCNHWIYDVNTPETYQLWIVEDQSDITPRYYFCMIDRKYQITTAEITELENVKQILLDLKSDVGWWEDTKE